MSAILMNEVRQSWKRNSILLFLIARDCKELQNFFKPSSHIIVQTQGAQGVAEKIITNFHMIARSRKKTDLFSAIHCKSLRLYENQAYFQSIICTSGWTFWIKVNVAFPWHSLHRWLFLSFEYILSIPTTILWSDNSTRFSTPRWPYLQY